MRAIERPVPARETFPYGNIKNCGFSLNDDFSGTENGIDMSEKAL